MTSTTFRIHLGKNLGMVEVPESMINEAEKSPIWHTKKFVPLDELYGDIVIKTDYIRFAQLGWLFKNREISYLFVDKKKDELNLGIRPPNPQAERSPDHEAYQVR